MVDAIVSTVIKELGTIVRQEVEQEVRLVVGVEKDVDKLSRTFMKIRTVLKDAEKKQITDDLIALWLQDLTDVAYDIDDVLDEWRTSILKSQLQLQLHDEHAAHSISPTNKVCSSCNLFSPCYCFSFKKHKIGLRRDIGHRIKELNERLDQIASDQNKFGFIANDQSSRNCEIRDGESRRRILETSSIIDVREVFGRDMDRETIISKLLSEGSSSQQEEVVSLSGGVKRIPMIISIVGLGGIGKTTLAQTIFNDDRVKNHFNKRLWIYVSKSFDKMNVSMHIIREMGGNENIGITTEGQSNHRHDIAWEVVHHQLTNCVNGKHFLLVLDDVWNEDPMVWDPLRLSLQCGPHQDSRIIVTTRNEKVAIMMDTTYVHRLGTLCDQDCWSLLKRYAFVGRQKEECEKLEEIGIKLANKCNGLPLFAKTLGSLLCFKKSKQDWQYVLENDVWSTVSSIDKPVLPAFLLSYDDLPSHLKQCFTYCSGIPKGFSFRKKSMITEWMAQGFLSDSLAARSHEDFDTVGGECFNNLVMHSFLQKDVTKSNNKFEYYQMHDLVHDFARSLVENECFSLVIKDGIAQEFNSSTNARYLSLLTEEISTLPSFIYKAKNLRTLRISGQISSVSSELFCHLTCLRTLVLRETHIEELPNEIEKFIHLRYLDLSFTRLKELPKTVIGLYNLQALNLNSCRKLCRLPEGIRELVNLVQLFLVGTRQLGYLPEGMGKLTKLRGLTDFVIGGVERGGCKIGELKDLNCLQGFLRIRGLGRVENGNEATIACLKNKQHLRALYFYFNLIVTVSRVDDEVGSDDEGEGDEKEEEETDVSQVENERVDGSNEVESRLRKIEAKQVDDGDPSVKRMEDVLESLQPNPNLEKLVIKDYLGAVFPNWMVSHVDFMSFSNLVFLELNGWLKCKQLPSTLWKLPSLETLALISLFKVKFMNVEFFGMEDASTSDIIFPKLKVLELSGMLNMEEWDMRVEGDGKDFIFMPCLQSLVLINMPSLRSFPQHLTSPRRLMIWNCPKLSWMPSPYSHLPFLRVEELILKKDAGSFFQSLLIQNNHMILPKLKLLRVRLSPYSSLPQGLGKLTSLEILDIRTCFKIKSIPEEELHHLTALQELRIMRCPALRPRCQKEIGEDWNKISHIPKIFIDGVKIK